MNRLHPLSTVQLSLHWGFLGLSVPFFALAGLSAVLETVDPSWSLWATPIGFTLGVTYGLAYYYRFAYELEANTFDVTSGVFSRRAREIPFRRIQNVDVRQGVLHQLVGVAVVTIETAGGGDTEATLNVVSEAEATRLQREIRRRTSGERRPRPGAHANGSSSTPSSASSPSSLSSPSSSVSPEPARRGLEESAELEADGEPNTSGDADEAVGRVDPAIPTDAAGTTADDHTSTGGESTGADLPSKSGASSSGEYVHDSPTLLFDLKSRELLLYSFTSFRIAAAAGAVFLLLLVTDGVLGFLVAVSQPFGGPVDLESATTQQYSVLGIISLVHGVAVTYLLGVLYTFANYYDFRLGRTGEDLIYERGLLQRYSGSIPLEKIQSVTVTDNPLQRALDYTGLWVETAGYGPNSGSSSQSAVPLARDRRVYRFAERLTGVESPTFDRPTRVARRRYLVRYSAVASGLLAIAFGISLATSLERWWLVSAVFLAVPPAAHLRWANLGYYVGSQHVVIRAGFWRRRITVVPYYRLQTVSTRRTIFQRRLGLASLVVDTASSRTFSGAEPTIHDVEYEVALEIHETTRERLRSSLRERSRSSDSGEGDGGVSVAFT